MMKRAFATCALLFALAFPVFAGELAESVPDFRIEGTRENTLVCDSGITKLTAYSFGNRGIGAVLYINNKLRYYYYLVPNNQDYSPYAFSIDINGEWKNIHLNEWFNNIEIEAPNLSAKTLKKKNDCVIVENKN